MKLNADMGLFTKPSYFNRGAIMNIWISSKLYSRLPWICVGIAMLSAFLPPTFVKWACIAYLLGYAGYVWYVRFKHRNVKVQHSLHRFS